MSSTTLKLPYKRFVAQVSTGAPRSKSTYLSLMAENLEALKTCPWREAADVPVALADHDFTKASHLSDASDAFKMTGNYDSSAMTEVAYAGMAAYRYKVPSSALVSGSEVAISALSLPISRDRFLKGGVRIVYELTSRATPSGDWDTVRGGESPAASAYLANTAAYLVAAKPADGTKDVDLSGVSTGNPSAYLWIYVTLEDYTDWWDKYTATEARQYAIEGSAMLVGGSVAVTFDGDVTPDNESPAVLLEGGSSPTWLQPLPTVTVGSTAPSVPAGDPLVETFYTSQKRTRSSLEDSVRVELRTSQISGTYLVINVKGQNIASMTWAGNALTKTGTSTWSGSFASGSYTANVSVTANVLADSDDDSMARLTWNGSIVRNNLSGSTSGNYRYQAYSWDPWYMMLQLTNGVPTDVDQCDDADIATRRGREASITGDSSPWTVTVGATAFTVTKSGSTVTMKRNSNQEIYGTWTSAYSASEQTFFDASVRLYLPGTTANGPVANYGLAAVAGDFSHAVATFEQGTQPTNAELLGRLARMSRETSGAMAYLHPAVAALADELDVLRPVPRFFRVQSGSEPTQTTCQPGLSAWYHRPHTTAGDPAVTTMNPSEASVAIAYRDRVVSVVKVANPVFLQLALLALRAPSAFSTRLVLTNFESNTSTPTTNIATDVVNHFKLRFVAWFSPADEWDGSNAFAMAAMASMPSVYRSDGEASVSWQVDCSGSLMPLGVRTMTARRIGVSEVVAANIAAGGHIDIPLDARVGEGDVVLIAPEVLGFNTGTDGDPASAYFGRQADPASAASKGAWARYTADLGWFPRVTGE